MKKKLLTLIIIVTSACVLLGVAAFFLFNNKEKEAVIDADSIAATMVDTETLTTNLKSDGYIQLRFQLQTSSAKAQEELSKRNFQVRNIALRLASSMTAEELSTPNGMNKLEEEMKKQINMSMQNGQVVKIFITDKMIH